MIFFGHVGITVGVVQAINHATGRKVDLRKAAFFAIAPDLLDKPVALLYRNSLGNHTRLWGHSLLFAILFYLTMRFGPKKLKSRYPVIFTGCFLGHLFLDRIWIKNMYSMLWPLLEFPTPEQLTIAYRWSHNIFYPWNFFGELLGFAILAFLTVHYRLYLSAQLENFLRTGVLSRRVKACQSDSSETKFSQL